MKKEEIQKQINEARKQGFYDILCIIYALMCLALLIWTFSFEPRNYNWVGADGFILFSGIIFYFFSPIYFIVNRLL